MQLGTRGRLETKQVAVLSAHRRPKSSFADVANLGGRPMVDELERWRAGEGILYTTIRSFKGLEADAVILADVGVPDAEPHFTRNDFYVAASRAKHLLAVLVTDDRVMEMVERP